MKYSKDNESEIDENIENKKEWILGLIIFTAILLVFWGAIEVLSELQPKLADRALFGDSNGTVNTLFSALAFGGIIFTILLQRKELKLQREELKDTREELKRTADAQEISNNYFNEQLRLSHLPVIRYKIKKERSDGFSSSPYNNNFFSFINTRSTAFQISISVVAFDTMNTRCKNFNYQLFDKNDSLIINVPDESTESIVVMLSFKDVLGNQYYHVVELPDLSNLSHHTITPERPTLNCEKIIEKFELEFEKASIDEEITCRFEF
ncbi:hypothetical protein [Nonlabens ulvanivorans]|uniref:hypothetical protein n=1 Tax=Nonlabens ulvanivorans TaxID=906888 RepID=UPI0037C9B9CF